MDERLICPVCRAGFREKADCPRCGADLRPLMAIAARAWQLRGAARRALEAGDFAAAHDLARHAWRLHHTPAGEGLFRLTEWLAAGPSKQKPAGPGGEEVLPRMDTNWHE